MKKILVVDDDLEILKLIKNILKTNSQYNVTLLNRIDDFCLEKCFGYDLIILDIMLSENTTGYDICESIRNEIDCPIIFLTAKTTEEDLLKGFSVGADDYIKKPFSPKELLARIKSHLDREDRKHASSEETKHISGIDFNFNLKTIYINEKEIELTKKEYEILE